jgi:hypothetical protein
MARNKGKENNPYWIDKKEFYQAVCDHREQQALNPDAPMPDYIGQVIINIATGVMSRYNFNRYSYRDEMISDAILTIIKYYNTFDINKSDNPYGYFWLAAYRAGQRKVILEKEQQAIKAKTVQNMVVDDDILTRDELVEFNSYMSDFSDFDLEEYEASKSKKNKKKKKNSVVDLVTTKKQRDEAKSQKESE